MLIGKKIHELRKERRMSMTELSKLSGIQMATLSRMENLKMTGTLESHMKIAQALKVSLPQLYNEVISENKKVEVKTAKTPADVFVHSEKSSYEILTAKVLNKRMMPSLLKIEPGGQTNLEQNHLGCEKFIFVLDGKIEVRIEKEIYPLAKNNTLYFEASSKHQFVNTGKTLAKVICVSSPVAL